MTSLLSSIGRSLLISCMIPAIVFITVTLLIFAPELPTDFLSQFNVILPIDQTSTKTPDDLGNTLADFSGVLAIILVISFLLAYVLMIMNWVVVRIFEGYYIPPPMKNLFITLQRWRKIQLARRVKNAKHRLEAETEGTDLYQQYWRKYIETKKEYNELFSSDAQNILPTRLGNVYRAFEDYPFERYGIDGLFFWERLSTVIPEDYASKIEEINNGVAFLLNSSLVSCILGCEVILKDITWIDQNMLVLTSNARPISFRILLSFLNWRWPSTKILLAILCFGLGYFFYHAAVSTARTFGRHVRTCYDLFRLELLDKLEVDRPNLLGSRAEKALWRSVHEFLALGENTPYKKPKSGHSRPSLTDTLRSLRGFVWLSVRLRLWQCLTLLFRQMTITNQTRIGSQYVAINDSAD